MVNRKKKSAKKREWNWIWQFDNSGILGVLIVWYGVFPRIDYGGWYHRLLVISLNYIIAVLLSTLIISYLENKVSSGGIIHTTNSLTTRRYKNEKITR